MEKEKIEKRENPLVSIFFNIIMPVIILTKLSKTGTVSLWGLQLQGLGPLKGLLIALAFPTLYFVWDYWKRHKTNFVSIVGFVSILLTGVIGVFEFPSEWIAYKEASVPFIIGVALLVSLKTPFPLVKKLLYNREMMDVDRIDAILQETHQEEKFEKTMVNATYIVAASFLLSTILNFTLAKILIKSPTGTEEFAQELGQMTGLSYLVIALPSCLVMCVAMFYLFRAMKQITHLPFEQLLSPQLQDSIKDDDDKKQEQKGEDKQ